MDNSMIGTHSSQRLEMSRHPTDHSWNTSDGFQEDATSKPLVLTHSLFVIAGDLVKASSDELDSFLCKSFSEIFGLSMSNFDVLNSLHRVDGMLGTHRSLVHEELVLRRREA